MGLSQSKNRVKRKESDVLQCQFPEGLFIMNKSGTRTLTNSGCCFIPKTNGTCKTINSTWVCMSKNTLECAILQFPCLLFLFTICSDMNTMLDFVTLQIIDRWSLLWYYNKLYVLLWKHCWSWHVTAFSFLLGKWSWNVSLFNFVCLFVTFCFDWAPLSKLILFKFRLPFILANSQAVHHEQPSGRNVLFFEVLLIMNKPLGNYYFTTSGSFLLTLSCFIMGRKHQDFVILQSPVAQAW